MTKAYRVTVTAGDVALILPRQHAIALRALLTSVRRGELKSRDKEITAGAKLVAGGILLAIIDSVNWEDVA